MLLFQLHNTNRVILELSATDDSFFEFQELSVVYNGTDLDILDYGNLTAETLFPKAGAGLGTYGAEINGSNIEVKFTPTTGLTTDFVCNSMRISFDHTKTGVGTANFQTTEVDSRVTSITGSATPGFTTVSEYNADDYGAGYFIVSVKDTTNGRYQLSEVAVASTEGQVDISEYGIIFSDVGLGTVGAGISNSTIDLHFYPEPSIDCNVQVYKNAIGVADEDKTLVEIPLKMVESEVNLETTEERREISEDDLISNIEEILYLKSILMDQIQLLWIHPQTNSYFQITSSLLENK